MTLGQEFLAPTSPEPIGVVVDRAESCWIWDTAGKRYLDLLGGIGVANIGHTHPEVNAAVEGQLKRHHHVMVYGEYVQEEQAGFARELCSALPPGLDQVYFTNSGAEAVEGALKLARKVTGRSGFVSFDGAYHGDTLGALSLAGNAVYRDPFKPLLGPVTHLPFGEIPALREIDATTAAVVIEPIQGEGGVRVPKEAFLYALAQRCQETGALLILDEVMTGFGRTGTTYAFEHWGLIPDILITAKALGGGFPLGGFISSRERLATLADNPPLSHVTTFGGHPVSCAAGRAALRVLQRDGLAERALQVGEAWRGELRAALGDEARDVRGMGLMVGVELGSADLTARVTAACREAGILLGWTLHHDNILRLVPPLVTPEAELERAARELGGIVRSFS